MWISLAVYSGDTDGSQGVLVVASFYVNLLCVHARRPHLWKFRDAGLGGSSSDSDLDSLLESPAVPGNYLGVNGIPVSGIAQKFASPVT